jgi:hypothetical protein
MRARRDPDQGERSDDGTELSHTVRRPGGSGSTSPVSARAAPGAQATRRLCDLGARSVAGRVEPSRSRNRALRSHAPSLCWASIHGR